MSTLIILLIIYFIGLVLSVFLCGYFNYTDITIFMLIWPLAIPVIFLLVFLAFIIILAENIRDKFEK